MEAVKIIFKSSIQPDKEIKPRSNHYTSGSRPGRLTSLEKAELDFMGGEQKPAEKILSKKSSNLFWDQNGKIDTPINLIPLKN